MTHPSVKTLRHYHQVGLLEPADVNPDTGYRYYTVAQIPTVQVIRRLRDLEMPVADVKAVLAAPDAPARNALATHRGALHDIDVTYGQLGSYVTTHEIGVDGPLREYYLVDAQDTPDEAQWQTEIAWPIFRAT